SMAVLFVSVPLLAYGLGRGFGVERPAPALLGCLLLGALGALGLAWAESRESGQALQPGQGELLFFVGCLCSALYPVLSKWGLEPVPGRPGQRPAGRRSGNAGGPAAPGPGGMAGAGLPGHPVHQRHFLAAAARHPLADPGGDYRLWLSGALRRDAGGIRHPSPAGGLGLAAWQPAGAAGHGAVAARRRAGTSVVTQVDRITD